MKKIKFCFDSKNRIWLVCICLALVLGSYVSEAKEHQPKALASVCTLEFLQDNLIEPMTFAYVPKYGNPFWTDSIPQEMRDSYVSKAIELKDYEWTNLDPILFSQFRKDGNRTNYESFIFDKRAKLANLAMAELVDGQGVFLNQIISGLHSMCEETWWGIPAHYPYSYPMTDVQPLALFSAESAALVAWIYYLYEDEIKEFSPLLYERVGNEIKRRVLDEGLNKVEWWRGTGMNWNPWICSNWLACVLLAEPNRERQIHAVQSIVESLDAFIDKYPDDGGCDEGPMYFDRASGALLDVLAMLKIATNGSIDMSGDPKILNMATFIGKLMIDNGLFVNFADSSPKINVRPSLFAGANAINDNDLMRLVASLSKSEQSFFENPVEAYNNDNFPSIGREMMLLPLLGKIRTYASDGKSLLFDAWLPNIEVITARSYPNSSDGLFFAAKGGHNDESHNHNDVGSFIVYADGQPLIVDPGIATYTAKSFTDERYGQWNVQSLYHNAPIINGCAQHQGRDYASRLVKADIGSKSVKFSVDIAKAYPDEAKVDSWIRHFDFNRGKDVCVTEEYVLSECPGPVSVVFMLAEKPEIKDCLITFNNGEHGISYNSALLDVVCEEIPIDDSRMRKSWETLYRLMLTVKSPSKNGKIKYRIY